MMTKKKKKKAFDMGAAQDSVRPLRHLNIMDHEFSMFEETILRKGWSRVGMGRHRVCYTAQGDIVIKVSRNASGIVANLYELFHGERGDAFDFMNKYYPGDPPVSIPIPRVLGHTRLGNLSILCVEWVERSDWEYDAQDNFPLWVDNIDCDGNGPQFGTTKEGRMVCFDWANF